MNNEEALVIVEKALSEERLSKLQVTVFQHAWEEQSYQEIARNSGYELGYVKQTGSQLWQLLSQAFGEKVTKSNVQLVLKRKAKAGEGEQGRQGRQERQERQERQGGQGGQGGQECIAFNEDIQIPAIK